jgi:hypothetical protein
MTLALLGVGGDARLSFTKDHIRLSWAETTGRERKMIAKLIKRARKANFGVVTVDSDGKPDKPARWQDLPGMFGKGKGEVLLQGATAAIKEIATELVNDEIIGKNIVSVAQADGTWKIVKELDTVKPEEGEKKEVQSTRPMGGG